MNEIDKDLYKFCRIVDAILGIATLVVITAIPLVLAWIFR